ncbi:MAG: AAA family ATPase [Anaerolineae bacterium]|nr:AAA family ATPase [Anaerolineae bacterium]
MEQAPIRVLIVSNAPDLLDRLLHVLIRQEDMTLVGLVQSLEDAIDQARRTSPDIVLVGEKLEGEEDRLRRLAIQAPLASVIALCPREDTLCAQRALLAGARAFVPNPFTDDELCTVIREVYEVEAERRARLSQQASSETTTEPAPAPRGQLIGLLSPKGGAGRSTIAANLALLLRQETGKEVALVEARRTLGDLDTMLNLVPNSTLADLGPDASSVDEAMLDMVLLRHSSGIRVLLAPSKIDEQRAPDPAGFEHILDQIQQRFDYVVADAGPLTDPYVSVILQRADRLLVVVTPEMPALQRAALFLDAARQHGFPTERLDLILNRATARGGVAQQDVQERLGVQEVLAIPDDVPSITYSTNQGVPLALSYPKSAVSTALKRLARQIVGTNHESGEAAPVAEKIRFVPRPLRGLLGIV